MRLSRDDLLNAKDNLPEEVDLSDIPGYHGSVLVRGMTGKERDAYEVSMLTQGRAGRREMNPVNARAKLAARCVVDEDGNRLLTDADAAALGDKSAAVVIRIANVAARLSGMGEGEQEELTRDFGQAGGEDSSSSSPAASARRRQSS